MTAEVDWCGRVVDLVRQEGQVTQIVDASNILADRKKHKPAVIYLQLYVQACFPVSYYVCFRLSLHNGRPSRRFLAALFFLLQP